MSEWIIPLITLTAMEIVLGIDNVIFIAIVAGRLPPEKQDLARKLGLGVALITRLSLLFAINFVLGLTDPVFMLPTWLMSTQEAQEISVKDMILLAGGVFLIAKSTIEIHAKLEGEEHESAAGGGPTVGFASTIAQIALLDIVFSLDSVITAVGMVKHVQVIVVAMVITVGIMMVFAGPIGNFVARHPTLKVLALSFLILIGVLLVAEGLGQHLNKGYIYFAMAFSFVVEMLNLRLRGHATPAVKLHEPKLPTA